MESMPQSIQTLHHIEKTMVMPKVDDAQRKTQQAHRGLFKNPELAAYISHTQSEIARIHRSVEQALTSEVLTDEQQVEAKHIASRINEQLRRVEGFMGGMRSHARAG